MDYSLEDNSMKVGDFVKVDHKYMSPLTAKRYNNNPMGLVVWVWARDNQYLKVMFPDGIVLSFPTEVVEVLNESR